ncbi:hypothetical protein [Novosphingobium sp. BL-52-GroH]|uniref:hypothetical protein n=1 Tax=Novosphingobium sp. BL-52-GroH TaxID=3349877 RepID=UPI00385042C0
MKVYSKDGVEMMDVKTIDLEGEKLVVKGKMMGAMAAVIHIGPEDMWEAFTLFPTSVKMRMPGLLWRGWRASRKKRG